nr:probable LRR receptor-like serine/threonine-protein kinase At3g47570 [Ipomoea batatas]
MIRDEKDDNNGPVSWTSATCGDRRRRDSNLRRRGTERPLRILLFLPFSDFVVFRVSSRDTFLMEVAGTIADDTSNWEIPKNVSHCVNLMVLLLGFNNLTGKFPLEFGSLSKLQYVGVVFNHLMGEMPAFLGNFSSLKYLSFSGNYFKGKIPASFGCLPQLFGLSLFQNSLTSTIPISIFNLSSLTTFDAQENQLQGYLPSNLGTTLPNLEYFNIGENLLVGRLPPSISNATSLWHYDVRYNGFIGGVPSFSGLKRLKVLVLFHNPLGNGKSTDLNFLSSLLNSTASLLVMDLEYGMGSAVSTLGDMYSYGILLLEIFTGKSPTSYIFNDCLNLHNYVKMAIPDHVVEIMDPKLFHKEVDATPATLVRRDQILECLVSIFEVGVACSVELPGKRMNIGCAIKELSSVKDNLMELGDFEAISL